VRKREKKRFSFLRIPKGGVFSGNPVTRPSERCYLPAIIDDLRLPRRLPAVTGLVTATQFTALPTPEIRRISLPAIPAHPGINIREESTKREKTQANKGS
jgi:hypothetical protein